MRKLPYCEGTWFAVPLVGGGFGVGIVARAAPKGKIMLAYFFGPKRSAPPTLAEVEGLKARDAVLRIMVGDLGLIRGEWPIVGQSSCWRRSEWPMPAFVLREGFGHGRRWLVCYADDDPSRRVATEAGSSQTNGLGEDALYGAKAAEIALAMALARKRARAR